MHVPASEATCSAAAMEECYKLWLWLFLQTLMLLVPPCHSHDSICPFCCPEDLERGYGVILSVDCSQSYSPVVTYRKNSTSYIIEILRSYYQCTNSSPIQLIGKHGREVFFRTREITVNEELSEGTTCSFHGCYLDDDLFLSIQPVSCTVDINECEVNPPNCSENSHCVNTVGSYTCDCDSGYEGDGFNYCQDVDECSDTQFNSCSENSKCVNAIGNYTCQCNEGYDGNGFNCSDIDECDVNNTCGENGDCINTVGSYYCDCDPGYENNMLNYCQDVNECSDTQLNSCSENAMCNNTIGSYTCQCNPGYEGNGFNCSDIIQNDDLSAILAINVLVFAVLVVVITALIIICCVGNKLQDSRRKRHAPEEVKLQTNDLFYLQKEPMATHKTL